MFSTSILINDTNPEDVQNFRTPRDRGVRMVSNQPREGMSWEPFASRIQRDNVEIKRGSVNTIQINLGKLCNQTCTHCHVDAGPNKKKENMDEAAVSRIFELIDRSAMPKTIDLTGGAPEMNPHFRFIVQQARKRKIGVIDRCNLTVLSLDDQESTPEFLASNEVNVVASLPCYTAETVEAQRGDGVFDLSIEGIRKLNLLGYGHEGSGLCLDLVYNPSGPFLPPGQHELELQYKKSLDELWGIKFNRLLTITNMPIKRFLYDLKKQGAYGHYMKLLVDSYNSLAADSVMCKSMLSISWDGKIYDCDFNQMLDMPVAGHKTSIWEIENLEQLAVDQIKLADHCYGCTAGVGSSCSGSLV